jgi:hypothetical protein
MPHDQNSAKPDQKPEETGFFSTLLARAVAETVEKLFSRLLGATMIRCITLLSNKDSSSAHS